MAAGILMSRPNRLLVPLCTTLALAASVAMAEETGQALYEQYCAACHGVQGEGDPRWPKLNEAGDLTAPPHNEAGHTWRHSTDELIAMTLNGHRDPYNTTELLTMPAYNGILNKDQIQQIIDYVSIWWTDDQRNRQQALDR